MTIYTDVWLEVSEPDQKALQTLPEIYKSPNTQANV